MKAMILAAGRGERMLAYTDNMPKPLLSVGGTTLIERNLVRLQVAGVQEVVINVNYLGQKIIDMLGDGERYGLRIAYSIEDGPLLNTGGGIKKALSLLGGSPFLVMSSDIWTDYPFHQLVKKDVSGAHIVLVDNPIYHPQGDFSLKAGFVCQPETQTLTYGNIAILNPSLFDDAAQGPFPLSDIFEQAIAKKVITGERYDGAWFNVGTPRELAALNNHLV